MEYVTDPDDPLVSKIYEKLQQNVKKEITIKYDRGIQYNEILENTNPNIKARAVLKNIIDT
jgi:hypothetical protein